ncbi:MAG: hypothetical protein R3304_06695 [Longimicrobiales bacterium]|nr:hypothetical protein [Longimicrobiales bacterium]
MRNRGTKTIFGTMATGTALVALLLASGLVGDVAAQDGDARWTPFIGCWEAVGAEDTIGLLCFTPTESGVELTNVLDGEVASTERFAADGEPRPISAEGCEGWESVEFSRDGRRAFTRTEFTCAESGARSGTGVMAFTSPDHWVDVRVLEVEGEEVAWVQEYALAGTDRMDEWGIDNPAATMPMAILTARRTASAPIDLDDVEEASSMMGAPAVEAWIVAEGDPLDADADALVRLDDAGVPDRVIDAVVAVSYPDHFVVASGGEIDATADAPRPSHYRGYMGFDPWFGPSFGFGYYGYGRYGYSPFYSPWGYRYGYGYWGSRPGVVIIERRDRPSGGRVYNGRGYRQGSGSATGRSARPRGAGVPSFSRGGSRGGSVAPSRGSTGRRATPRKAKRRSGGG